MKLLLLRRIDVVLIDQGRALGRSMSILFMGIFAVLKRYGTEAEILLLKRFLDPSVSSLIPTGWCERASHHQNLAPIPMVTG